VTKKKNFYKIDTRSEFEAQAEHYAFAPGKIILKKGSFTLAKFTSKPPIFFFLLGQPSFPGMEQHTLKNVNNSLNTNIYSYLETSGGQSSDLHLNVVHFFSTPVLIRHL
jgi:hypothetical protein